MKKNLWIALVLVLTSQLLCVIYGHTNVVSVVLEFIESFFIEFKNIILTKYSTILLSILVIFILKKIIKSNNKYIMVESISQNLKTLMSKSNDTNENQDKGIGKDKNGVCADTIREEDLTNWKLIDISGSEKFYIKWKGEKYEYGFKILKYDFNKKGNPILVIPGYSSKSGHWTFGRINNFIRSGLFDNKNISTLYIILFVGLKEIISDHVTQKEYYSENVHFQVSNHIDKIIRSPKMKLENLKIIARSAGASHGIVLSKEKYVDSLYLAAPGYNKKTVEKYTESGRKIPIHIYWSINDRYINLKDEEKGILNLQILMDQYLGVHIYKYIDNENHGHNHRIPPELVKCI